MELAEQSPTSSFADVNKLSCAIHPIPKSARTITVLTSRRLRYKMAKFVMRIEAVAAFDQIGQGKGGYWEDRGYDWYAGI